MCFIATKSDTDKLRNSRKRVFWKIVKKNRTSTVWNGMKTLYRKGRWAHSNAKWKHPDKLKFADRTGSREPIRKMSKGIYVYYNRPGRGWLLNDIIIKVHAEPQDLIGAAIKTYFDDDAKACFTKVKVLT